MARKRTWAVTSVALALLAAQGVPVAQSILPAETTGTSAATAQDEKPAFSREQIEQMVAPIALYPDSLLAQVFMSATYPLEIVQASRWLKKNSGLKGEALDAALREQPWDPSIKTMVLFPTVLQRMNDNLDWTQDLGDAFLAQEQDLMDAVQRLRKEAQKSGALKDTPQQKVVVDEEVIVVEPADPQTVYVPTYNPATVYGIPPPATTYYPTVYEQPVATTSAADSAVAFGAGALVGGLLTAAIMWDDDDWRGGYHIGHPPGPPYWGQGYQGPRYGSPQWNNYRNPNVYRSTNVNVAGDVNVGNKEWNRQASKWEHNPEHRGGVKYKSPDRVAMRNPEVRKGRTGGGIDRDVARGRDGQRPASVPAADRRPGAGDRAGAGQRPDRSSAGSGDRERPAGDRPQAGGGDGKRPSAGGDRDRPGGGAKPPQRAETREARPQQRVQAPERSVSRASDAGRGGGAFQGGGSGGFERQASQRGAASRAGFQGGGGGINAGGGGGGFKGAGGGGRGGGGGGGRVGGGGGGGRGGRGR